VDADKAAPAIAMAVPQVLITVGSVGSTISGTPRSRIGAVLAPPPKRGSRFAADVILRLPTGGPTDTIIAELAASLATFAATVERQS
jgi:hypothetical protein